MGLWAKSREQCAVVASLLRSQLKLGSSPSGVEVVVKLLQHNYRCAYLRMAETKRVEVYWLCTFSFSISAGSSQAHHSLRLILSEIIEKMTMF